MLFIINLVNHFEDLFFSVTQFIGKLFRQIKIGPSFLEIIGIGKKKIRVREEILNDNDSEDDTTGDET